MHARLAAVTAARAWAFPGPRTVVPLDAQAYGQGTPHLVVEGRTVSDEAFLAPTLHVDTPLIYGAEARLWLGLLSYDEVGNKYRTSAAIDGVWHQKDLALLLTATSMISGAFLDPHALGLPNPLPDGERHTDLADGGPAHTLDTLRWEHLPGAPLTRYAAPLSWTTLAPRWAHALAASARATGAEG